MLLLMSKIRPIMNIVHPGFESKHITDSSRSGGPHNGKQIYRSSQFSFVNKQQTFPLISRASLPKCGYDVEIPVIRAGFLHPQDVGISRFTASLLNLWQKKKKKETPGFFYLLIDLFSVFSQFFCSSGSKFGAQQR